ncbi:MAG: amidohydrolase [Ruminococcus sp.]|nr:amidohydrolase [Ruminococcus sp.]
MLSGGLILELNYIDFHVHAFADKIAERTIQTLAQTAKETPATNGTLSDTKNHMQAWGIDGFALLSIATKPTQHLICNNWASSCKSETIFPFGSVHPDSETALQELERIKALGLYGVKLHPDYQNFFVDETRMIPIYQKCGELNLPVILHAGVDPICPDCIHCTPDRAIKALHSAPKTTFILAHAGGNLLWEEVEQKLAGKFENLYFDTAVIGSHMQDTSQLKRIILKHGADKILFASDCPWDRPDITIKKIKSLGLTSEQEELIFSKNAKKLLRIS